MPVRTRLRATGSESGLSAVVAFLVSLGILVIAGAVFIWTGQTDGRPLPGVPSPEARSPSASPTPLTEALEDALDELTDLRYEAYSSEDPSTIDSFLASNSPLRRIVTKELRLLQRRSYDFEADIQELRTHVVRAGSLRSIVIQTIRQDITITDANGQELDQRKGATIRKIRWVLVHEDGRWLLYNSRLLGDTRTS